MSLLDLVESDNAFLLEDADLGMNRPITFTEEDGVTTHQVVGQVTRVAVTTDPGTGLAVRTDKSSVTVRISSLQGAMPKAGWTVTTTDVTGAVVTGKIPSTDDDVYPDRTLGRVTVLFKIATEAARYDIVPSASRFRVTAAGYNPATITATSKNRGLAYSGRWRVKINDGPVVYSSAGNEGSKAVTLGVSPFVAFGAGFPGWTLGAGARVSHQGWVGKIQRTSGVGNCGFRLPNVISGFTPGTSTIAVRCIARLSPDFADPPPSNLNAVATAANSGGILAFTGTFPLSTSWTDTTSSPVTVPASADRVYLSAYTTGQTAGTGFVGWLGLYIDGILVKAYDMSDTAGWVIDPQASVVYDPTTAYLGNSYDGTARDTLVLTSGEATALSWPTSHGKTYRVQADLKQLAMSSGTTGRVGLVWLDSLGTEISREGVAVSSTDSGWLSVTGDFSAPDGAATAKVAAWIEGTATGVLFVGKQAEIHEVVSGEVVGTKSVTFELYEAGGFTSKVRMARVTAL